MENIGIILRLLRIAFDLSVKELSQKIGVSSAHISSIENGKKSPSLDLLYRYSEVFGVSLSSIMLFHEEGARNKYDYKKTLRFILSAIIERV